MKRVKDLILTHTRKLKSFVIIISCIPILSSCWSTEYISLQDEYNRIWKNASKNEIIRQNGVPTRTVALDDGESVLVYENYSYVTNSNNSSFAYARNGVYGNGVYANSGSSGVSKTTENRSYAEFFLNKYGNCYMVKTNHQKAIKKKRPDQTAILVGSILLEVTLLVTALSLG